MAESSNRPAGPALGGTAATKSPRRRAEDFFVAGGPVAPDRACYVRRAAERQLFERLLAHDYCHVIAPRFSGKSSLATSAARRLREAGALAAVVDLSQLGSRDGSTEVGRWYYGLAYRVARDLRLKIDLQGWWQEHMPLAPAQRLGEFFWAVVLGATRSPVTVFLDEIESVEQSEYAAELFKVIRACFDARAGEPEYGRLSFVLLGTALPSGAAERASKSVTEISTRIDLKDFRFDEARVLAEGLGLPPGDAERALYRVFYWTAGHPYLTQRLCQAIARNPGQVSSDGAVDGLVAARFLGRNVVRTEASMSRVLDGLDRAGKLARPSLRLYRRIHRGRRPRHEPDNPKHELLRVCGLATVDKEQRLTVRNRIYAEAFSRSWAREALPVEWGRIGRVATVAALVLGSAWAYFEVLPRPYEETLRVASVEIEEAEGAWQALRRLPGFRARADRLFARVLVRRSRLAGDWAVVAEVDERLRELRGHAPRADALLVDYWERHAAAAEAAERRDEALLFRLRAFEAGPTADGGRAAELASGDYAQLSTVIRTAVPIEAVAADAAGRSVVTLGGGNVVQRWDAATGAAIAGGRLELLTEEFLPVRRRVSIDTAGRVAAVRLELSLSHEDPARLHARLVAPSGRSLVLSLADAVQRDERLVLEERQAPGLRAFRGEGALGTWSLELEDRQAGAAGMLVAWRLQLSATAGHRAEDRPENPLLLDTPTRSSAVVAALAPDGSFAAAAPRNPAAGGRLHTWELASGESMASIDLAAGERRLAFAGSGTVLLLERQDGLERLRVLDARDGSERFSREAAAPLAAGPAASPDDRFFAAVESEPRRAWVRELDSGKVTFQLGLAGEATAVAVAPGGLLLAVADRDGFIRLWRTADGTLAAELEAGRAVRVLRFDPAGRWLVAGDEAGRLSAWDIAAPSPGPQLLREQGAGHFAFDSGGRRFAALDAAGGLELWALGALEPLAPVLREGSPRPAQTEAREPWGGRQAVLTEDGRLIARQGVRAVRVWQPRADGDAMALPRVAPVVALASSGLRAAAGTADGRVLLRLRDLDSLDLRLASVSGEENRHGQGVAALAFAPDGARLASAGGDGSVLLWDARDGSLRGTPFQHGLGKLAGMALGPDGRTVVLAGERGARAWNAAEGRAGMMFGAGRAVSAVALGERGDRAFIGTPDGVLESWDIAGGERLWFDALDAPVSRIALGSDGARVAAGSQTGLVGAWGMAASARRATLVLPAPVLGLAFSPDDSALLAQTPGWLHRLGIVSGRLQVLSSRMLPASVPPGGWRSADPAGTRVVLIGGMQGEAMSVLDFERLEPPREEWTPDLAAWQQRLKLFFNAAGELVEGAPATQ